MTAKSMLMRLQGLRPGVRAGARPALALLISKLYFCRRELGEMK